MFSVVGTMPMTLIGAFKSAMARIAQMTAAPPAMSSFMRSMPSAGLMEMPPVSNVTPLPTSPSTGDAGAPAGLWRITITRGGSALPRATPRRRPIPSCPISRSPSTSTATPALLQISAARSAKIEGVRTFEGSLDSSLAKLQHSPEDSSAFDACLEGRPIVVGAAGQDQDLFERGCGPFAALVAIGTEGGKRQPFRRGLDRLGKRDVAPVEPREPLHATLPGLERRRRGYSP